MKKFEYRLLKYDAMGFNGGKLDLELIESEFGRMGEEGWELVDFTGTNSGFGESKWVVASFKRAVE